MIRNFEIHNDRLNSVKYPKGVTGNVNTYVCQFDIACDIPDLIWFCIFKQGGTVYRQLIENSSCLIPSEVLVSAEPLYIGCYGTNADDNITRVSTNLIYFDVKEGAYSESTIPDTPTPDVWETLVSKTVPIIGENGNWFTYDLQTGTYVDTGKPSQGGGNGDGTNLTPEQMANINDVPNKADKSYVDEKVGDVTALASEAKSSANSARLIAEGANETARYAENIAEEVSSAIGDIETALDNIIDIQNNLIGGGSV